MTRYNKCELPGCHNPIRKKGKKPLEIVFKHALHAFGECPSAKDSPDGKCHHKGKHTRKVCSECFDMYEDGKGIAGDAEPTLSQDGSGSYSDAKNPNPDQAFVLRIINDVQRKVPFETKVKIIGQQQQRRQRGGEEDFTFSPPPPA